MAGLGNYIECWRDCRGKKNGGVIAKRGEEKKERFSPQNVDRHRDEGRLGNFLKEGRGGEG